MNGVPAAGMPSRLELRLEASIREAIDPVEADVLRAELAALYAREGRLAEAREALVSLKERHAAQPQAATAASVGFAAALVDYYSDLDVEVRGKLQQARALAASAGRRPLQALCAAWLALLDFVHNDATALGRDLVLAFTLATPDHHAARSRASMAAAMAYHHAGRFDLAQPWYARARRHATEEGDTATISALMHNMAALRASQASQAAVLGPRARDSDADTLYALIGAQSSGYFDDGIGRSALPVLHGVLRAQMFALQDRPREALAIYHAHLDTALARRYRQMFRLGIFDRPVKETPIAVARNAAIAREIGEQGAVLLKNDRAILPLDARSLRSVALIGQAEYATKAVAGCCGGRRGGTGGGGRRRRVRPAGREMLRIFFGTRLHGHQDAAFLDALLVVLDSFLRDAPADQHAQQAAGRAASAGADQRGRQRSRDHHADARQHYRGTDRRHCRGDGAQRAANAGADAGAFSRFRSEFGLYAVAAGKVALAGFVRHHKIDVLVAVAARGKVLVCPLGAIPVGEKTGDQWCLLVCVSHKTSLYWLLKSS